MHLLKTAEPSCNFFSVSYGKKIGKDAGNTRTFWNNSVVFNWDLDKSGQQKICQETVWMVGGNFVNSESSSVGGRDPHQVTEPAQYVVGCTFYDLWLYIV